MYARVNGIKLFFDVDGKELEPEGNAMKRKPVCFILHGGPGDDHSSYKPALDPLTKYMQLVYIDFRGSGRSDYPDDSTYTVKQNVLDIEALRIYLGLERIAVFGQSYGGIVAQAYGIAYPQSASALMLLTTTSNHRAFERAREELKKRGSPDQIAMAEKYLWPGKFPDNETYLAYYKLFANMYTLKPVNIPAFNEAMGRAVLSYKALNRGFGGDLQSFDFDKELCKISCPCLLIGGRQDWVTPIACTQEMSVLIPDCRTVIIEDSSHIVLGDQYEKTMEAIINFVSERLYCGNLT
ncbi:alpha/beta fold hydrolase [Leadbettera azotonutricia]|uniref:Prolyl aminopeptidase n=1 Tax=Leadbettera azotonutricia (strain ATCC BAA-888 / DSM 13862 / ZAS-9) TaxID=545695 RepID=F5Y861_LEAAZ|nr:alpha/beta fold hydrolase [Leadbettera azotonutricia]AEF83110.1 prolyl aminopeptidase [Leadbettera azotonutricia ZAS-9]